MRCTTIYKNLTLLILFSLSSLTACHSSQSQVGKTLHEVDIIRHGARTTLHVIPGVPYPPLWATSQHKSHTEYNLPPGQLTYFGMQEAMLFAQGVRADSQSSSHFLPKTYSANNVCVRSTGINRTIMTGMSALTALYPTLAHGIKTSHDIVIDSIPYNKDDLLFLDTGSKYVSVQKILASSSEWEKRWHSDNGYALYQELYRINPRFFSKHHPLCKRDMSSGEYKRCLEAIVPVADNVQTLQDYCAHNSHCSVRSILGLSQSLQHRTLEAFGWVVIRDLVPTPEFTTGKEGAKYLNAYRELAHATGVRLMSDIANNLKHYANTGGQSSYTLFSAHDSTLFYALNDLLIHNQLSQNAHSIIKHYPGFVANLSFQLYQDTSKVFRVRVIYYNSYKARQEHKGAPVLDMPLDQFYSTYFDPSAYAAIQNKDTCDYTRLVGK